MANGDPNRPVVNLGSILTAVLIIVCGGLTTWLFKLDDRQFNLQSQIVTRVELNRTVSNLENRMNQRFDRVEVLISKLFDLERQDKKINQELDKFK